MTTTTYVDANLHHDQVTGKAVTACLHIVNATPSHWYTKRQATVETATYGSEFVAARIVREAIAAGYLQFNWKDGKSNPADILSTHWEFANIWPLLKPLLFWKGDTDDLNAKTKGSDRIPTKKSLV